MGKKIVLTMFGALFTLFSTAQVTNETTGVPGDTIDWEKYLDQVTVSAVRPLVKMEADKMTYDVQGDVDSKSATVLDMLRKVPMVTVDGQDNIKVNGSGAFKVYVDGKPSPMFSNNPSQIFKMMPAAAVSKIEVITNPGAKYDAEGAVGVLNLVLAKAGGTGGQQTINGMTGTVRGQIGNRGYGGGASFSAQEGKLSVSGNLMTGYQRLKDIDFVSDRYEDNGTHVNQSLTTNQRTHFGMGTLSLSYDLDSLNTLGGSLGLTMFRIKSRYNPTITTYPAINAPTDEELNPFSYSYRSSALQKYTSIDASADWQHFFSGDRTHYLTLSYLFSQTPQRSETTQDYDDVSGMQDLFSKTRPKSSEHTIQLDYVRPLAEGQTLNLGAKYINRQNRSKSYYYNLGADEANALMNEVDYSHSNNIAAGYAEYELSKGIFSGKGGLRYEHTWQKIEYKQGEGHNYSTDYGNLVPSLSMNLRPSMTSNIGLTYNMRISRPGITYLNPYIDRTNPLQLSYGNSDLEVEKNHNFGLSYSIFSTKFMMNIGLQQSICNNRISEYSFIKDGLINSTYGNIVKERNTSLNLFMNWLVHPNTRITMNAGGSYADLRSSKLDQRNHGWEGNLMLGVQQTLPWDLKLSLNWIGNSKSYSLQGWSTGFNLGVVGLTKSFMNDRLNLSFQGVTGIGNHGKLKLDTYTRGNNFENRQKINVPIAQFAFTVSYTFGNTKVRAKEHKSRIENDFTEKKSDQEQMGNAGTGTGTGM